MTGVSLFIMLTLAVPKTTVVSEAEGASAAGMGAGRAPP